LPFPEAIFPQITYSRSRQNHVPKISNFPANSGKVRYPILFALYFHALLERSLLNLIVHYLYTVLHCGKHLNFSFFLSFFFFPNEKVPSAYITRRPERESAILVDPPRAKALGHQLRDIPLDFVSWISSTIFPWREKYRQIAPSPARVDVLYIILLYNNHVFQAPEFKGLLFALMMFTAVICERRKFGSLGFNIPYDFTQGDVNICISQLNMFLMEYAPQTPLKVWLITQLQFL